MTEVLSNNTRLWIFWEGSRYNIYKCKSGNLEIENKLDKTNVFLQGDDAIDFEDDLEFSDELDFDYICSMYELF